MSATPTRRATTILHLTNLAKLINAKTGTPLPDLEDFHWIIDSTALCYQRNPVFSAEAGWHTVSLVVSSGSTGLSDTLTRRILLSDDGLAITSNDNEQLRIYPNPAHDKITVEGGTIANAVVTDLTGRVAKVVATGSDIDISGLRKGVYTLSITTKDGKTAVRKFVKK